MRRVMSGWRVYEACWRQSAKNAKRRGIEFTLAQKDMVWLVRRARGRCEVSQAVFDLDTVAVRTRRPFYPSIDRIDSTLGYTPSNVRLVCVIANYAMNEWGVDALLRIAQGMANAGLLRVGERMVDRPNSQLLASISWLESEFCI